MDQQPVDMLHGEGEVGGLVLLQLHVDIAESAADQRVVSIDDDGQGCLSPLMGEAGLPKEVSQMPFQYLFLHREAIGEG